MLISIVLPAYNEEKRIRASLENILSYTKLHEEHSFEIIVVADGPQDNTVEIVKEFEPDVTLIDYTENQGKGYAIRTGVEAANGDWIYLADVDLSTPINELDNFLAYTDSYDCIIGSRATPGAKQEESFVRKILGKFGNLLINLSLGLNIEDTQCGFKLFSKEAAQVFEQVTINRWGYDFEVLYLVKANGYSIKELPVTWIAAPHSTFKFTGYFTTFWELLKVWWKHVKFSRYFWKSLWQNYHQLIKYLIVGVSTNVFNIAIFLGGLLIFNITRGDTIEILERTVKSYQLLETAAYVLAVFGFNFFMHKLWTFGSKELKTGEFIRYMLLVGFNYLASISILTGMVELLGIGLTFSKIISTGAVVLWNFFALKLLVYRK